jgi:hypothetical protein
LAKYFKDAKPGSRYPLSRTWSQHILWGNHRVSGGVITPGANAWGTNIVWGEAATLATNIVWGENCAGSCYDVAWGRNIVWGLDDNIVWGLTTDPNASWGSSGTDGYVFGDETAELEAFDPLLWDLEYNPAAVTVVGSTGGSF